MNGSVRSSAFQTHTRGYAYRAQAGAWAPSGSASVWQAELFVFVLALRRTRFVLNKIYWRTIEEFLQIIKDNIRAQLH